MRSLWETQISPNVIYSLQLLRNDKSALVVDGIDSVLCILNQNTGEVVSSIVVDGNTSSSQHWHGAIKRFNGRRLSEDTQIDNIPRSARPPITCLAVGLKKVVTTHNAIRTLPFKISSHQVFPGSTSGYTSSWDLRTMRRLWETRVILNFVYSVQLLQNEKSTLVVWLVE